MTKHNIFVSLLIIIANFGANNFGQSTPKQIHIMVMVDISGSMVSHNSITDSKIDKWNLYLEQAIFGLPGDGDFQDTTEGPIFPLAKAGSKISLYTIGSNLTLITSSDITQRTQFVSHFYKKKSQYKQQYTDLTPAALEYYQEVDRNVYEVYWVLLSDEQQDNIANYTGDAANAVIYLKNKYPEQIIYRKKLDQYTKKNNSINEIKLTISKVKSDYGKYLKLNPDITSSSSFVTFLFDSLSASYKKVRDNEIRISPIGDAGSLAITDLDVWVKIYNREKIYVGEIVYRAVKPPFIINKMDTSIISPSSSLVKDSVFYLHIATRYKYDGKLLTQDLTEQDFVNAKFVKEPDDGDNKGNGRTKYLLIIFLIFLASIAGYIYFLLKNKGVTYTIQKIGEPKSSKQFSLKPGDKILLGRVASPEASQKLYDVRAINDHLLYISEGLFSLVSPNEKRDIKSGLEFVVINADANQVKLKITAGNTSDTTTIKNRLFNIKKR
jgi:hypothetical protein